MVLTKLQEKMKELNISAETLAEKSQDFSNMTVRRAIKGRGIDRLKAVAIARALKCKLETLV